jgi:hypothetical protein
VTPADCTDYSLLDLNYVRRTTVRRTDYLYSVVITTLSGIAVAVCSSAAACGSSAVCSSTIACGSAAVWQCEAVWQCYSAVQQCVAMHAAVCSMARNCVRQCVAVRVAIRTAVCGSALYVYTQSSSQYYYWYMPDNVVRVVGLSPVNIETNRCIRIINVRINVDKLV